MTSSLDVDRDTFCESVDRLKLLPRGCPLPRSCSGVDNLLEVKCGERDMRTTSRAKSLKTGDVLSSEGVVPNDPATDVDDNSIERIFPMLSARPGGAGDINVGAVYENPSNPAPCLEWDCCTAPGSAYAPRDVAEPTTG